MHVVQKIAAAALTGALSLGTIAALPSFGQEDPTGGAVPGQEDHHPNREERRAERLAAMATALGVTEEALTAATETAHQAVVAQFGEIDRENPPTDEDREVRREAFKIALAEALGVSTADLEAAHDVVFADRLAAQVAAGHLTEEQAAEMAAAKEDGTLREYLEAHRQERAAERLAEAVARGRLTQDQADRILERISSSEGPGFRRGGPGGPGGFRQSQVES